MSEPDEDGVDASAQDLSGAMRLTVGLVQLVGGVVVGLGSLVAIAFALDALCESGRLEGAIANVLGLFSVPVCLAVGVVTAGRMRRFQLARLAQALAPTSSSKTLAATSSSSGTSSSTAVR